EMSGDDGAGAPGDAGRDGLRRDVQAHGVDVGEHGDRLLVENGRDRTHVGDRGGDDLVTGLRVDGGDRGVAGGRPRAGGAGVRYAIASGERLLLRALGAVERPRVDHLAEQGELIFAEVAASTIGVGGQDSRVSHRLEKTAPRDWTGQAVARAVRPRSLSRAVTVSAARATPVFQAVTRG